MGIKGSTSVCQTVKLRLGDVNKLLSMTIKLPRNDGLAIYIEPESDVPFSVYHDTLTIVLKFARNIA